MKSKANEPNCTFITNESRLHQACLDRLVPYDPPKPTESQEETRQRKRKMQLACDAAQKISKGLEKQKENG